MSGRMAAGRMPSSLRCSVAWVCIGVFFLSLWRFREWGGGGIWAVCRLNAILLLLFYEREIGDL